jgi:GT2 family glycosyltransferase
MTVDVTVAIVTYGSADDLPGCFEALAAQEHRGFEVVVVDCASADGSVEVAREADLGGIRKTVVPLGKNLGFAGGMNEAFRRSEAPYFLTLNADTRPASGFLSVLLGRFRASSDLRLGAVTPRLVRPAGEPPLLDACGMVLKSTWRHLDRGSGEVDRGQYMEAERVFGGTGAATLWSREALDDVALDGSVFDPDFHSFREDAELSFRLRERGWEVVYEPRAVAEHRRSVLPENRREQPAAVNRGSLRNRYLLRAYHQTRGNFLRTLVPTLARDLGALAYVVLFERTSLPAYAWLWRRRREIAERRRLVQGRRTVAPSEVERWFRVTALPLF